MTAQLPDPWRMSRIERGVAAAVRAAHRVPGLRRVVLAPVVARPGYWFVTGGAYLWGRLLRGRYVTTARIRYFDHLPRWAYGRGGTTVGAIYLTGSNTSESVLEHEAVHREQWKRYGLAFIPLYIAAGIFPLTNRFEIEADLDKGGYLTGPQLRPQGAGAHPA